MRPSGVSDTVLGVDQATGNLARFPVADLPPSRQIQRQLDALAAGQQTDAIYAPTLSALQAIGGTYVGQGAFVVNGEGAGQYSWSGSAWQFIGPNVLAGKADKAAVAAMIDNGTSFDPVRFSIVFDDMSRSWLEVGDDGRPTEYSALLIAERAGPFVSKSVQDDIGYSINEDHEDIAMAFRFADGSIAFAIDREGNPLTRVPRFSGWPAVAYGDSTTAGADLASPVSDRWTTLLATHVGKPIWNFGVSGERSDEIQFRAGGHSILASVSGGSLAGSGGTLITFDSTDPLRASTSAQQVVAICEDGQRVVGRISASGSARTFTRALPGAAITTGKIRLVNLAGEQTAGKILFVGQGVNDEALIIDGKRSLADLKAMYRTAQVNQAPDNPTIVVWGMLDRGIAEAGGTAIGTIIRDLERWLLEEFGSSYCPVRPFLASEYGLAIAARLQPGFTATAADRAAITAGTVPPSYRVAADSVHLNPLGHKLQAWTMYQHLLARGIA